MEKRNSESGKTILMALLVVLVAVALGAAILTSAASAARHVNSDRRAQQNYLTVSSAAALLRGAMEGSVYTRTYEEQYVRTKNEDGTWDEQVTRNVTDSVTQSVMAPWLLRSIDGDDERDEYASFAAYGDEIQLDLPLGTDGGLRTVYAAFSSDANGVITVLLSLEPEDGESADDCRMTLTLRGTRTSGGGTLSGEDDNSYTKVCTTTITWGSARITKGIKGAES